MARVGVEWNSNDPDSGREAIKIFEETADELRELLAQEGRVWDWIKSFVNE